jgi:hypothetical protein
VLLGLQFVWLSRLERYSAIAHRAALENYLAAIGNRRAGTPEYGRRRGLKCPRRRSSQAVDTLSRAIGRKRSRTGARKLFLVDYTHERFGNFLVLTTSRHTLEILPGRTSRWR